MNCAMRRRNAEEWALVCAAICLVHRHAIAVRELPVNLRMKVRKGRAHVRVELPDASLIGAGSWLGGVIHEIVRKELFEHVEVPSALNLLGITAHHGFRRVRYGVTSHRMSPNSHLGSTSDPMAVTMPEASYPNR